MALPEFNEVGDLPPGVHQATLNEVVERFGVTQGQRGLCTRRLLHVYALAQLTGHVQHFIIFGSYVTVKPDPNDVDVVLVMDEAFHLEDCPIICVNLSFCRGSRPIACAAIVANWPSLRGFSA